MGDRLSVNSGETYSVGSGETEEWSGADVSGTLDVDGTLKLIDNPDTPEGEFGVSESPLNLPLGPLNMESMNQGLAIFLIGMMGTMFAGVAVFKNYIAGILLFFSIIALLLSGLFGIGLELFWSFIAATAIAMAMGMVVRYAN